MVLNIDHHPSPLGLQLPWMVSSYCVWGLPAMIPTASQMILGVGVAVRASWPSHFAASASVYSTEQSLFYYWFVPGSFPGTGTLPSQAGRKVGRWAWTGLGRSAQL